MSSLRESRPVGTLGDELHALATPGQARQFRAGELIFSAGDPGDGFHVVESGRVQITADMSDSQPRVLASIGPGDFFGEMAILEDAPRSATARAETDTRTLFITRHELLQLLERRPQLALSLSREFSKRVRGLNHKYLDEILQAERLAVVGRFAATIVHDFKNPLAVISLAAELACSPSTPNPIRMKAEETISRQIGLMSAMLQELIEFNRPKNKRPSLMVSRFPQFMLPLAEEIRNEIDARGVSLDLENMPPDLPVNINPLRLSRVFYNLINNAIDEMPEGGGILLRFAFTEAELRIEVEDTGKGIAPEIAQQLFEPFATHGKVHGTGLGLSICKKIVEDHGGRIWAASAPNRGATFCFTLPIAS